MWEQLSGVNERWVRRVRVVRGWGRRERVDWILRGGEGKQEERRVVLCSVIGMLFARDKVRRVVRQDKGGERGKKRRRVRENKKFKEFARGQVLEVMNKMESKGVGIFADQGGRRKIKKT